MFSRGSDAISPTAHYTAEVWRRHGLSDPALGTWQGRLMHLGIWPLATVAGVLGAGTLDAMLLARHRLIDECLTESIEDGRVGQIVEIAAGLSPRGLRFRREHPDIAYVEADLPAMAERKRDALAAAGAPDRVADLDALTERGPGSLAELAASLDGGKGTAVVTEGLLNYFPREAVEDLWRRIAAELERFPNGLYTSDLLLRSDNAGPVERVFGAALGVFVRGFVHFPFEDEEDAIDTLAAAGFTEIRLHPGTEGGDDPGSERVSVIEARL